ncbi:helix-turn-helix domain-containing protein [Saccharopolyspora erythraea]|uniref:helix-turn-helix domain-containing protein n=1 Tax=Saccharopolyspora erythraea TaxID=1836 RepID=UPI001BA8C7E3|nr:helix-turn-helix transcriptional regulator [Saccharopolyspora erythraea]QUG99631.1 helix-turn-helix domain-containing protein [Saccharopolyspora erythraea]
MGGNTGRTPKARALGAELRELRQSHGVSQRELARRVTISNASMSRYETGDRIPTPEDVASIVTALGEGGELREKLIEMARDAAQPNWLSTGASTAQNVVTALMEFERTATHIVEVAPMIVPGLLQCADYARAIMAGVPAAVRETRVAVRLGRRDILTRRRPVDFEALIAEHVLRSPIGGRDVMADQLHHLAKFAELPNVTVRVIPTASEQWSLVLEGACILFTFPKAAPIVHLENYRSSTFLYDAPAVTDYVDAVASLRRVALSPDHSMELLAECADEMERVG